MKFTLIPQSEELYKVYETRLSYIPDRGDAGLDLVVPEDVLIRSGDKILLDLQVKAQLMSKDYFYKNKYHSYLLMPRSSIATSTPLMMVNSVGLIDSGYTGNLKVSLINVSDSDFVIKKGSRLVQLVTPNLKSIKTFDLINKEEFNRITERADGGFGSTNK